MAPSIKDLTPEEKERLKRRVHRVIEKQRRADSLAEQRTLDNQSSLGTALLWLAIYVALFVPFAVIELLGVFWRNGFFENDTLSRVIHFLEGVAPRWVRLVVTFAIWSFGTWLAFHIGQPFG